MSIRSSDLKITFGEVPEADKDSAQLNDDDIYIMMQCLSVCHEK